MTKSTAAASVLLFSLLSLANAAPATLERRGGDDWRKSETFTPEGLMDWEYFHWEDPTEGFDTAVRNNLIEVKDGKLITSVDSVNTVPEGKRGRDSVRLQSPNSYGGEGENVLMVFDVYHLPTCAGTWAALWLVGDDWPRRGEVDILEGWGGKSNNQITLHTGYSTVNGQKTSDWNCDMDFSSNGRPAGSHNCWGGGGCVEIATFTSDKCDLDKYLWEQRIILNITFCSGYGSIGVSGGEEECKKIVGGQPGDYANGFWELGNIHIYKHCGQGAVTGP